MTLDPGADPDEAGAETGRQEVDQVPRGDRQEEHGRHRIARHSVRSGQVRLLEAEHDDGRHGKAQEQMCNKPDRGEDLLICTRHGQNTRPESHQKNGGRQGVALRVDSTHPMEEEAVGSAGANRSRLPEPNRRARSTTATIRPTLMNVSTFWVLPACRTPR